MSIHRSILASGLRPVAGFSLILFFALNIATSSPQSGNPEASDKASGQRLDRSDKTDSTSSIDASADKQVLSETGDELDPCGNLAKDYPLRSKLNGKRLPLNYAAILQSEKKRWLVEGQVRLLSDGRMLVGLGDTLYMLGARGGVEWTQTPSWIVWDFAVIESTGLVYGTGGDNTMFILDAATGKNLYLTSANGKGAYGHALPFGKDMCLITDNLAGYRDDLDPKELENVALIQPDGVTAWRGTEVVWSLPLPPDADLLVNGDRILAVTKTDKSIYVRRIIPPVTAHSK